MRGVAPVVEEHTVVLVGGLVIAFHGGGGAQRAVGESEDRTALLRVDEREGVLRPGAGPGHVTAQRAQQRLRRGGTGHGMVETDRRRDGREFGTGRLRTGPPALFQIGEGGYPAEAVRQRALRGPRGEGRVVRTRGQFRLVQQPGRDGEQEQRLGFLSRDRDQGGQPQGEARVGGVRMRDDRGPARQERLPLSETVAGGAEARGSRRSISCNWAASPE